MTSIFQALDNLLFNIVLKNGEMKIGTWKSHITQWKESCQKQFL